VTNLGLDSILISEFSNDKQEHQNGKKNEDFIYSTVMIAKFSIFFFFLFFFFFFFFFIGWTLVIKEL
ncbi:hypothetical protein KJR75_29230, partial [Klebsiella pneumoniae]